MESENNCMTVSIIQPYALLRISTTYIGLEKLEIIKLFEKNKNAPGKIIIKIKFNCLPNFLNQIDIDEITSKKSSNGAKIENFEEDSLCNELLRNYTEKEIKEVNPNFYESYDDVNMENEMTYEEKEHDSYTFECENKNEKNVEDKKENELRMYQETNIATEKESTKQNKKEEYETKLVEKSDEKSKVIKENDLQKKIRFFSSEKNKEIDIMEINQEYDLLKNIITHLYFDKNENEEDSRFWLYLKQHFNLKNITICFFEIYIIFTTVFNLELCYNKINEIYQENYLSILFFKNLIPNEEIENIIKKDILSINTDEQVKKAKKIKDELKQDNKEKKDINKINEDSIMDDKFEEGNTIKIKKELMEKLENTKDEDKIKKLLEILFLDFESLINDRRFIYEQIREYIINYFKPFFEHVSNIINENYKEIKSATKQTKKDYNIIYDAFSEELKNLNCNPQIIRYGSYDSGLFIENSDMDVLVYLNKSNNEECYEELNNYFENCEYGKIKGHNIDYNIIELNFYFQDNSKKTDQTDQTSRIDLTLKVDLKYTSNKNKFNKLNQYTIIIKNKFKEDSGIYKCCLILKKIFNKHYLNKVYYGGISSYGIQSLVFNTKNIIPKSQKNIRVGILFFIILEKYSNFDFYKYVVEKDGNEKRTKLEHPITSQNPTFFNNMITIVDPLDENNILKMGYTNWKYYKHKPKNFILEKIIKLFRGLFEILKNDFSKYKKNKNKNFLEEMFEVKIDTNKEEI